MRKLSESNRDFRAVMWSSAFVLTTIIFIILPSTQGSEMNPEYLNALHEVPTLSLDMECLNGGVGYGRQCICPSYVSGPQCENAEHCSMLVGKQFTLSNPFTGVPTTSSVSSCEVQPPALCCWRDRLLNQTNDVIATGNGGNAWIKSMLENYGPWTSNDKLMLSYFFGDSTRPGSISLYPSRESLQTTSDSSETRLAFVIMVHSDFESRISKLMEAIYSNRHVYVIHVDKGAGSHAWKWAMDFVHEFNNKHSANNVHLVKHRFSGAWGSVSLAYQEIASIIELLRLDEGKTNKWSHVINLSAYDFPLKPVSKLEAFLNKHKETNFIEVLGADVRRESRQSNLFMPCNRTLVATNFLENDVCATGSSNWMFRRSPTWVYGEGSQWHFLSRQFVEHMVSSPDIIELLFSMKYTLVPDEAFFQSAFLSSPFTATLKNYNYRYLPWADKLEVQRKHVNNLIETDAFFVRKLLDTTMADVLTQEVIRRHI